jgi:two-component system invasion response regulator UvrY
MNKITLLIIDDHALIRETWSFLLSRNEAFEVIADVGEGQRAMEIARDKRPGIVLLDINMAPIDGFEILRGIRKLSPGSKVIAVSMHSQPSYAKKMLRMGAKGYVTKNSPTKEMVEAIKEVVAGNIYICQEVKNIISMQMLGEEDDHPGINLLSERELQIINHLRDGLPSKDIADKLGIATKTVEVHRYNIMKKLKLKNVASLIGFINSSGL